MVGTAAWATRIPGNRLRHLSPFDGPERLAGLALEDIDEPGLAGLRHDLDRFAVVPHGQQLRRGRVVVIPEIVVNDLEVPQPFARTRVEREQAIAKQVVPLAIAAVEIVCRRAGRYEDDAILLVERQIAPRVRTASVFVRIRRPRLVPVFARTRNRVTSRRVLS